MHSKYLFITDMVAILVAKSSVNLILSLQRTRLPPPMLPCQGIFQGYYGFALSWTKVYQILFIRSTKVNLLSAFHSSYDPKSIDKSLPRDYETARRTAMVSNRHARAK
jgi:hypothetical protein